jgi:outer membrane protein OmpA-like peptidoglycan-associated protein
MMHVLMPVMALLSILSGCSSDRSIIVEQFSAKVDSANTNDVLINWKFKNADQIEIIGVPGTFLPEGSYRLTPTESNNLEIIATNKNKDTLVRNLKIDYIKNEHNKVVGKGTNLPDILSLPSNKPCNYSVSIRKCEQAELPAQLRITGASWDKNNKNSYKLHIQLLDEYGNHLTGILKQGNALTWKIENSCSPIKRFREIDRITEHCPAVFQPQDFFFLIDNSVLATDYPGIVEQVKNFLKILPQGSHAALSVFNQEYSELFPITTPELAYQLCENLLIPHPSGLNGMNNAAIELIKDIRHNGNRNKQICLITHSSDNTTLETTEQDLTNMAKSAGIPVFIIGIGDGLDSYLLNYISTFTGGKYYPLEVSESSELLNVLKEILLSREYYYEAEAPLIYPDEKCSELQSDITLEYGENELTDKIVFYSSQVLTHIRNKIIGTYNESATKLDRSFSGNVDSLAMLLRSRPNTKIELLGYTGEDDFADTNYEQGAAQDFGFLRAGKIRTILEQKGCNPDQILVKSMGNTMPLFPYSQKDWQKQMNRRVEVRLLDSASLPFELVADTSATETEAQRKMEIWKNRGFDRVYFDRQIIKESPFYRIKIWGFPTPEDAQNEARRIESNFELEENSVKVD